MKKIVINLCFSLILSAMSLIAFAQNQTQGSGAPLSWKIDIYITSAETGCPTTGEVEGVITIGGNSWNATPQNYTGPGYYCLDVQNVFGSVGYAMGGATTDYQWIPSGVKWCTGHGFDNFNLFGGDPLDNIYFDMYLNYWAENED